MLMVAYACAAAAMVLLLADNGGLRRLTSLLGSDGAGLPPEELGVVGAVSEVEAVIEGVDRGGVAGPQPGRGHAFDL